MRVWKEDIMINCFPGFNFAMEFQSGDTKELEIIFNGQSKIPLQLQDGHTKFTEIC